MSLVGSWLVRLLGQLPLLLVLLAGVVLAVVTWRRHPKASLLALVGLLLLFVHAVVGVWLLPWLTFRLGGLRIMRTPALRMGVLTLIPALVQTVGLGCLLGAIFLPRQAAPGPASPDV
jgi:hypothetical protein